MKRSILVLACLIPMLAYARTRYYEDRAVTYLKKKDFAGGKTVVLKKPGHYRLCSTINFTPTEKQKSAICIDGNNIHLDLGGFSLSQANTVPETVGITLKGCHHGVSIVNGVVKNFTQLGIVVEGANKHVCLGEHASKLVVQGCGFGSPFSFVDEASQPLLQGGILLGQSRALEQIGYYTYKGALSDITVTNVTVRENSPLGMILGVGHAMSFDQCSFSANISTRTNGLAAPLGSNIAGTVEEVSVFGAVYVVQEASGDEPSRGIRFVKCHFDENVATSDQGGGSNGLICADSWLDMQFVHCTANSNSVASDTANFQAANGFQMYGGTGTLFEGCQASYNVSPRTTIGFLARASRAFPLEPVPVKSLIFRNCEVSNNGGVIESNFFGMLLSGHGLLVDECAIVNNATFLTNQGAFQNVIGIGIEGPSSGAVVQNTKISANGSMVPGITRGVVVISVAEEVVADLMVQDCELQGVVAPNLISDGIRGISLLPEPDISQNLIIKHCAISNFGFGIITNGMGDIMVGNTISHCAEGIAIGGTFNKYNTIADNFLSSLDAFALRDTNAVSESVFVHNKAFNVTNGYQVNYSFGPLPSVNGSLTTGFPGIPNACENSLVSKDTMVVTGTTADLPQHDQDYQALLEQHANSFQLKEKQ